MSDTPNYIFEGTPEQREYAAEMVHNRLRAETRLTNGKAALWYMGGIGILLALIGLGIGLAFWGYARYSDVSDTAGRLADTLKTVLEKVTVETKGEVTLRDGETVLLDSVGQTVKLEPGGIVKVDGSSSRVASSSTAPTMPQTRGGASYTADSDGKLVVEFTRFSYRPFGNGQVATGWKYRDNTEDRPYSQYCYYRASGASSDTVIDLAHNGKMGQNGGVSPIDRYAAAQECRWFDGSPTQTVSAVPDLAPTTQAAPAPFAPSSMSKPETGAMFSDWQNWCRSTYPATIQEWCLNTFGPRAKVVTQPDPENSTSITPPAPSLPVQDPGAVGGNRLRMEPAKVKSF
jgi:hypothetical protein